MNTKLLSCSYRDPKSITKVFISKFTKFRIEKLSDQISIENRPEIVNERKSRFVIINLLKDKSTKEMMDKAVESLKMFLKEMRKTIMFDNGTENEGHGRLKEELEMETYFCLLYHSWQKGMVENSIGLVRCQYPKCTIFSHVKKKS
ncbi:MAG: IS30 family transposase [Methanosarcinales archaeon]|nr:IS30 family transposase [Methanosarcinales archaeon]